MCLMPRRWKRETGVKLDYLAEASERSGPCVDQKKWARWIPEPGGAEILSRRQRTHTLIAYDGMGLELGDAGGRLNGS